MNAAVHLDEPVQVLLTTDDFLLLSDAGVFDDHEHTERIEGIIIVAEAHYVPHARAKGQLAYNLRVALEAIGADFEVLIEEYARLGTRNVRIPNIVACAGLTKARAPISAEALRLAVEIADSTLTNDLGIKATIYARAGIPEH